MKKGRRILSFLLCFVMVLGLLPAIPQKVIAEEIPSDVLSYGGHLYKVFQMNRLSWHEAQAFCEQLGGHLATITSQEENDALYQYIRSRGYDNVYFGLYDSTQNRDWAWITGETYVFQNWSKNEDNDFLSQEDYGMFFVDAEAGKWNDGVYGLNIDGNYHATGLMQTGKAGYLCEWENPADYEGYIAHESFEYNGHKYVIFDGACESWEEAKAFCEKQGGYLASITSSAEDKALFEYVKSCGLTSAYFGLTKTSGKWQWANGENYQYNNWGDGEPSNNKNYFGFELEENYGCYFRVFPDGKWNDDVFTKEYGNFEFNAFICEWKSKMMMDYKQLPILSEEDAIEFIGFLTNNGKLTEEQIRKSTWFKLMTGTYAGEDAAIQARALYIYAITSSAFRAQVASNNKEYLRKDLINFFEKELEGMSGLGEEIIDEYKNAAAKKLTQAICDGVNELMGFSEAILDVGSIYNACSSLKGTVAKAEMLANRIVAGIEGALYVVESEKAGRYTYFDSYLSCRGAFSSPENQAFNLVKDWNEMATENNNFMANFINCFTWATGKDSFTNHFDDMDRWGEYIYQLGCCMNEEEHSETSGKTIDEAVVELSNLDDGYVIRKSDENLAGDIVIPESYKSLPVISIAEGCFEGRSQITGMTIGDNVERIENNAFKGCLNMTQTIVGSNVQAIGETSFENCEELQTVVIASENIEIDNTAFQNCPKNLEIICSCKNESVIDYCQKNGITNVLVHSYESYTSDFNGNCKNYGTVSGECLFCQQKNTITDYSSLQEHDFSWEVVVKPQKEHNGIMEKICHSCEEVYESQDVIYLTAPSLNIQWNNDSWSIVCMVDANLIEKQYKNPYIKLNFNNNEVVLKDYQIFEEQYLFRSEIKPNEIINIEKVEICAECNEVEFSNDDIGMDIMNTCYDISDVTMMLRHLNGSKRNLEEKMYDFDASGHVSLADTLALLKGLSK